MAKARAREPREKGHPRPSPAVPTVDSRTARITLAVILVMAAIVRLWRLDSAPPGLNQDEALGAWNAWCLLKTGHTMTGEAWPIFSTRGIGDYPTMLFFYTLLPIQAVFGLDVWTTRLPSALAGIASVWLAWDVGSRLFDRRTGLLAAALIALNPWHLLLSRLGMGSGLCSFYALAPVSLLLRARLGLADGEEGRPRAIPAALAGLVIGLSCYGFHPMRLYFPALLALVLALDPRGWWRRLRDPASRTALLAFAGVLIAVAGPLAWKQAVDPALSQRWQMTRLWEPGAPFPTIARLVAGRYAAHFHPDFLFLRGDTFEIFKPDGQGEFGWHLLPGMLVGAVLVLRRVRSNRSARLLLALLLAYPAGDVISRYDSVHLLRSAPGVATLVLLGAWGWSEAIGFAARGGRALGVAALGILACGGLAFDGGHLLRYFGSHDRRPEIYHGYMADLVEASRWMKPRLAGYDAVYVTTIGMIEPWAVTLVATGHDPRAWFAEPRDRRDRGGWDVYVRYGRMRFLYDRLWLPEYRSLATDGREHRVLYVVRPGEMGLDRPVHVIRRPDGADALWLCDEILGREHTRPSASGNSDGGPADSTRTGH